MAGTLRFTCTVDVQRVNVSSFKMLGHHFEYKISSLVISVFSKLLVKLSYFT